ncbi:MAG: helix-turn-helix domain-containing protein [Spirochaetes bacterium]|nr:helix-turn-helix domain-containing protein [Spirochaetota bacterium]MBU1079309.1 helix-turn-helix domain-containing protein [Spirochaetota bacterium]
MISILYDFFRSSSGLALMVIGIGFFIEPGRKRVRMAFGALFLATGALFVFSWISEYRLPPPLVDRFLLIAIIFVLSQALFEITLFLFGDEARRGTKRKVYIAGAAWSALLLALPYLDPVIDSPVVMVSVEDGQSLGLFHAVSYVGAYAWPIVISVLALRSGRWHPSDLPRGKGAVRVLSCGVGVVLVTICAIGAAILTDRKIPYRIGQSALQAQLLAWYFYIRANPDVFAEARREIGVEHKRRQGLGPAEAAMIGGRLEQLANSQRVFVDPDLDLATLARAVGVPSYKLSQYFNSHKGSSFSSWLNAARIERACELLLGRDDLGILDIAFEVGYSSKGAFNGQFHRRVGMTPSEYRAARKSRLQGTVSLK